VPSSYSIPDRATFQDQITFGTCVNARVRVALGAPTVSELRPQCECIRQCASASSHACTTVRTPATQEPSDEEQDDITFEHVRRVLRDRAAAEAWLAWAGEAGLVPPETRVRCRHCIRRSWRALPGTIATRLCRSDSLPRRSVPAAVA
jgi:hypothetical protein